MNEKYIECLKKGEISFLNNIDDYERKGLIESIKRLSSIDRIINNIKEEYPYFCFELIYDRKEYEELSIYLLKKIPINHLSISIVVNMLYNTSFGPIFIINNIDYFFNNCSIEYIDNICVYFLNNYHKYLKEVEYIAKYNDLHIRFLFIKLLINYYPNLLNVIYSDIIKYLKNDNDMMDINDICSIAVMFLNNGDITNYNKIKEFIYNNYEYNNLAKLLMNDSNISNKKALEDDLDKLFLTSNYKFMIYQNYCKKISEEILNDYIEKIKYFRYKNDFKSGFKKIYEHGLGLKLEEYIDKYLSLSVSRKYEYVGNGTTTETYRIGDYVFKLSKSKWSKENIICPDLYLIAKDYEQDYVRNENNEVVAAIEVQKYLKRDAKDVPKQYFILYERELSKLGYFVDDTLVDGYYGDNTRLLDSYLDADTLDFTSIPEWFKMYPIVLVDRDRVYKKDKASRFFKMKY